MEMFVIIVTVRKCTWTDQKLTDKISCLTRKICVTHCIKYKIFCSYIYIPVGKKKNLPVEEIYIFC